jgi:hypothetical protein
VSTKSEGIGKKHTDLRKGDIREDGKVFWGWRMVSGRLQTQWTTPQKFAEWNAKTKKFNKVAVQQKKGCWSVASRILVAARGRAKAKGIPFNLTLADILIPKVCPVFGTPLEPSAGHSNDNSPTLDRIIPSLGYTKGNVIVVSMLANRLKSDATPDQILRVGQFYLKLLTESRSN